MDSSALIIPVFGIAVVLISISFKFILRESKRKEWIETTAEITKSYYKKEAPTWGYSRYAPPYIYRIYITYKYNPISNAN